MSRRLRRHAFVSSLAALAVTLLSLPAVGAPRDRLLRWIVPPDDDVAGYKVYVALGSMEYDEGVDIGFRLPDAEGVASYLYGGLESDTDYYVVMTAYDTEGLESVFSNEIVRQALACGAGTDSDGDGVCDLADNCLGRSNPLQVDSDLDGFGNICDADYYNSGFVDLRELARLEWAMLHAASGAASYEPVLDLDSDGRINIFDWMIFLSLYLRAPGPSGLGCAGSVPCAP
jgi:hypothetical protein